jgi:hypothetical protein
MLVCVVAADRPANGQTASDLTAVPQTVVDSPLAPGLVVAPETPPVVPVDAVAPRPSTTLTALHVSFGALQFMDVLSTVRGINAGSGNPIR